MHSSEFKFCYVVLVQFLPFDVKFFKSFFKCLYICTYISALSSVQVIGRASVERYIYIIFIFGMSFCIPWYKKFIELKRNS